MTRKRTGSLRVVVRGEGPNDYGRWDFQADRLLEEGCYMAFVRRAEGRRRLECIKAGRFPVPRPGRRKKRGIPRMAGFEPHAFYATLEAAEEGADLLVIGTDTDRGVGGRRKQLPQACRRKYQQLRSGHEKAVAFRPAAAKVRLVCLVPLVKLESWLLADARALPRAAGLARSPLPSKPEELYGRTDAKAVLDRLFEGRGLRKPDTAAKARLAAAARPSALTEHCPVSYPPFSSQVHAALS